MWGLREGVVWRLEPLALPVLVLVLVLAVLQVPPQRT